jgi:peptide/nickel transport system substrate-binding protein
MDFPKFKVIIAISLILFQIPTLVFSKPDKPRTYGDSLVIGDFVEATIINPILTHSSISASLKGIIFDGLIKLNEKMEPIPHLALSWENSQDGLTWIFRLRRDVRFHDGAELTAEDIKFTFDKIQDPSLNSPYISIFKNFRAVRVKDKYTLEINLEYPLPSLPFYLDVGILPKHLLMGKDLIRAEFNYHPIGTGPFKTGSWSKGEIILKANEAYFEGEPYLNKVIVKFFKDQRTVWAELMKENVDCLFLSHSKNYDLIEKIPKFSVYSLLNPYSFVLAFNHNNIYFTQKKVRQALNYAVDKERIVKKVLHGKGRVSSGTIYPKSWVYNKSIEPYPYDPKKAVKLLKKAGWRDTEGNHILDKDGKEFEFVLLIIEGEDIFRESALLVQQQLLDIGIRMKVKPLPFSVMYEKFLTTKEFDAFLLPIVSNDPEKNYAWWHSSQINHGFNLFSYKNKKIDELLDRGRTMLDREERKKIYYQFQKEIYDDPPGIFLFWRDFLIGIHKRFRGVKLSPGEILGSINEWYVPREEQKYRSNGLK